LKWKGERKMKNRAFGVEIEFAALDRGCEWVENELENLGVRTYRWDYEREEHDSWSVHEDGSEIEMSTPKLSGKQGFEELKYVMDHFKNLGCYTTYSDGLHVHHDAPDYVENREAVEKLVESWNANKDSIYRMVNPDRWGKYACASWSERNLERLRTGEDVGSFGRNDLNIRALRKYGTVEIRLHEGTLDYTAAEAWIKFGQMFLNSIQKRKFMMPMDENAPMLLRRVKMPRTQAKILERKAELVRGREIEYVEVY
jgi:hypothetical protein